MADAWGQTANTLNDLTKTILTMKGQNMQNMLSEAELGMRGRQFEQTTDLHRQQLQNAKAQLPIGQTDYSPTVHTRAIASIKQATGLGKSIDKFATTKLLPFAQDSGARLDTVYDNLAAMSKDEINELMTDVSTEHQEKLVKDPNYGKTRQAKSTEAFIDALYKAESGEQLAQGFMPDLARSRSVAEANSRAVLEQTRSAERAAMANPETQFMMNKTKQYMAGGLTQEDAAVKAYEDLSNIRARQAREGKNNITVNAPGNSQVESLAVGILDGTIDPNAISKRGGLQAAVWGRVKQLDPAFNIIKAGVDAKFEGSTATMQTKALLNTINPLLDKLDTAGAILGNSSIPALNKAKNYLKEQTGYADIVGFNNLRDAVIAEVERGLMGTGVLSDSKYLRELNNMRSSHSYPQLQAAIKNTKIVIQARLEALAEGPNAPITGQETPKRRSTDNKRPPLSSFQQ